MKANAETELRLMEEDEENQRLYLKKEPNVIDKGTGEVQVYKQLQECKSELSKLTDTKFMMKQTAALQLALQRDDFKNYDLMTKQHKKDDKQFVYDYLGEDMSDGKSLDGKNLNKEYDSRVERTKYQGFWKQDLGPNLNQTIQSRRKSHSGVV